MISWLRARVVLAELGFGFQNPQGGSQSILAPVPGVPTPSSGLCEHPAHMRYTDIQKHSYT